MTQQNQISFFGEDLAEGGGPPVQQNLRIQSAMFTDFNYGGRSPMVTALKLDLMTDTGNLITQHYACGDPSRVRHHPDGRRLTAIPAKTSNFGILMIALGNAGFPPELLKSGDIAVLNGLYAYWDGQTVNRAGLNNPDGTPQGERIVAVPTVIHQLPGGQAAPNAPAAPGMPQPGAPAGAPAAGSPQPGMPQPGMPQPGAPQPGMPQPGAPATGPGTPVAPAGAPAGSPMPGAPAAVPGAPAGVPAAAEAPAGTPAPAGVNGQGAPAGAVAPELKQHLATLLGNLPAVFVKQDMMVKSYDVFAGDTQARDAVSGFIFTEDCDRVLNEYQYEVEGLNVRYVGQQQAAV